MVSTILVPLIIAGILGGIALWSDQRVTASALTEHKSAEEARLSELKTDIRALRDEIRGDLESIRLAVERKK